MPRLTRRKALGALGLAVSGAIISACTPSKTSSSPSASPETASPASPSPSVTPVPQTFTFATSAAPTTLDPVLTDNADTFRITRQILQPLVGIDPLTSRPSPLLATSWTTSEDGLEYTFSLQKNVMFHDGTHFDARAVKANFDRWFNLPQALRDQGAGNGWRGLFGAFAAEKETSLFRSLTVLDAFTVKLSLTAPLSALLAGLSAPAFSISSPAALAKFKADSLTSGTSDSPSTAYAQHPVGTGPYLLGSWQGPSISLKRFSDYWADTGNVGEAIIQAVPSEQGRVRLLTDNQIDGFDLVSVSSYVQLLKSGMNLPQRDPFSVLILGLNSAFAPLKDPLVRQAAAYALNRGEIMDNLFLRDSREAHTFFPPRLEVSTDGVPVYAHDVLKARSLLKYAGYTDEVMPFYYPLGITRAYLPSPELLYARISRQLVAAGFNVKPVPIPWTQGYLKRVREDQNRAFHLTGFTGLYNDPNAFVAPQFAAYNTEFGYRDQSLFTQVAKAKSVTAADKRMAAYQEISVTLANALPAIPLAFPISAMALAAKVQSFAPSPVLDESIARITIGP